MADELAQSFSGAPSPPPPLSGLLFGTMGLSNTGQGSEGGTLAGGRGGPGMQAGPGLDILSLISQLSGGGGEGGPGAGISPLALGQQAGGLGTGSFGQAGVQSPFFQTIGQQGIAGGGGAQPGGQGGTGTQGDILSLLKALTSVGQKGTDLFSALQSPSGGTDLQSGTGQVGGYSLYGQPGTASPTTGGSVQGDLAGSLTGTNILQDPTFQLFSQGLLTGNPDTLGIFQGLPQDVQQQYVSALFGGGSGGSQLPGLAPGGYSLGVSPLSAEGGGGGSVGGGFDLGALSGLFGALGGGIGLGRNIQQGNVGGALQSSAGLYNQLAPQISQMTGFDVPTVMDVLSKLGSSLGLGAGTIGATGVGTGAALAPAATAGATAGELASLGATGAELGTGAATAGLGAGLSSISLLAAPFIMAAMQGLTETLGKQNIKGDALSSLSFGAFGSEGGGWLGNLFGSHAAMPGKVKEILGARKDYTSQLPTYAEGLRLPQEFQQLAGQFQGMNQPQEIAALQALNAKAQNIMNQGPVMSRAQGLQGKSAGIDPAWLTANSPTIARNAIATSIRTQEMLSQLGAAPNVANMGPGELAQWAGNYSGLGGPGQPANPAYASQNRQVWDPQVGTYVDAGTTDPTTGWDTAYHGGLNEQQWGMFQNPATLEQMLQQYVGGAGGNFGGSPLAGVLGGLPQIPQGFGLPQAQWNTRGFQPAGSLWDAVGGGWGSDPWSGASSSGSAGPGAAGPGEGGPGTY